MRHACCPNRRADLYMAHVEARQCKGFGYHTFPQVREGPALRLTVADGVAERLERREASVQGGGADRIEQQIDALAACHFEGSSDEIALTTIDDPTSAKIQWPALLSCCT